MIANILMFSMQGLGLGPHLTNFGVRRDDPSSYVLCCWLDSGCVIKWTEMNLDKHGMSRREVEQKE